jgi:hypothetical protein
MKSKTFDCVEMKRQGALRVHEILKDMTVEQQIEYWRQQTELMRQRHSELRARKFAPQPSPRARP